MIDPTEYDPNSKDITDDPDFVGVVGDNDHGDGIPEPKCEVCGVPWADHMGIMGVCLWNKALMEDLVNLRKDNAQLYKERDEARRWVCQTGVKSKEEAETVAIRRGWDCYKETP